MQQDMTTQQQPPTLAKYTAPASEAFREAAKAISPARVAAREARVTRDRIADLLDQRKTAAEWAASSLETVQAKLAADDDARHLAELLGEAAEPAHLPVAERKALDKRHASLREALASAERDGETLQRALRDAETRWEVLRRRVPLATATAKHALVQLTIAHCTYAVASSTWSPAHAKALGLADALGHHSPLLPLQSPLEGRAAEANHVDAAVWFDRACTAATDGEEIPVVEAAAFDISLLRS